MNREPYKYLRVFYTVSLLVTGLLLIITLESPGQVAAGTNLIQYTSPLNGSAYVPRESSVTIRYSKPLCKESVTDSAIIVTGSIRGRYHGIVHLCSDEKTLVFKHSDSFIESERITVDVRDGLYTTTRDKIPGFELSFHVSDNKNNYSRKDNAKKDAACYEYQDINSNKSTFNSYPEVYSLINDEPSAGYYFMEKNYVGYSYIMIIDNFGTPVFYMILEHNAHNFSLQPAGYLSYYIEDERSFAILDSQYNHIATYSMKNGYDADSHEFILLPDGHSFMIAYDRQLVEMDKVVEGGDPNATVVGLVIQELDEEQNVIFQWRSWDHFSILDTDDSVVDLTSQYIDYVHGNSLDVDSDTSLLLCSRNLNEVTKINRQTGDIIWRMGGKNNQFTFIDDNRGFAMQHSAKKLDNGNLILFDNGIIGTAEYSRGVEYELEETDYTVRLIKEFKHDSNVMSLVTGHIQRLPNGNTLLGWGKNLENYVCTEYNSDGEVVNDLYSDDDVKSYRVYKFDWKPGIIELDRDTLLFDTIKPYTSETKEIRIVNTTGQDIIINGYSRSNSPFYTATTFPIVIPPYDSRVLQIKFVPLQSGKYNDVMTIYSDGLSAGGETQRIAVQFAIRGASSWDASYVKGVLSDRNEELQLYPNPVTGKLAIHSAVNIVYLAVRDLQGRILVSEEICHSGQTEIDCSGLNPGIYMVELITDSGSRHSAIFIKK
jgi:hypothetical protein